MVKWARGVLAGVILLAMLLPSAVQAQDGLAGVGRRWILAAAGTVAFGLAAGLANDRSDEEGGLCLSRACTIAVAGAAGAGIGFLLGRDIERGAARDAGPVPWPELEWPRSAAPVSAAPVRLERAGASVIVLAAGDVVVYDERLQPLAAVATSATRAAALLPAPRALAILTAADLSTAPLPAGSPPAVLLTPGGTALAVAPGAALIVGSRDRLRRVAPFPSNAGASATPESPTTVAVPVGAPVQQLAVDSATASVWVLAGPAIELRDGRTLEALDTIPLPGTGLAMDVAGGTGIVAMGVEGAVIIVAENPRAPRIQATLRGARFAAGASLAGARAFVAAGIQGVLVYDLADPAAPRPVGVLGGFGFAADVRATSTALYVLDRERRLLVRLAPPP